MCVVDNRTKVEESPTTTSPTVENSNANLRNLLECPHTMKVHSRNR